MCRGDDGMRALRPRKAWQNRGGLGGSALVDLAPGGAGVVHGGAAGGLDRVQVREGDRALEQLKRDHGEGIHIHLRMRGAGQGL